MTKVCRANLWDGQSSRGHDQGGCLIDVRLSRDRVRTITRHGDHMGIALDSHASVGALTGSIADLAEMNHRRTAAPGSSRDNRCDEHAPNR